MDDLIQSTPFMPPTAKDMATAHVFVFGDQTVPFEQDLRRLLHVKDNDILRSLFDRVGFALRNELTSLPAIQQDWFPRFTTVIDLVSKLDETAASPVLKFTLLCLCEIGQFIG
jgi:naphtho-gamma-pyrone polyketide synthase